MSDDTPSPLNNVITIDDERIRSHLERRAGGYTDGAPGEKNVFALTLSPPAAEG